MAWYPKDGVAALDGGLCCRGEQGGGLARGGVRPRHLVLMVDSYRRIRELAVCVRDCVGDGRFS